jgi:hypothetical protein
MELRRTAPLYLLQIWRAVVISAPVLAPHRLVVARLLLVFAVLIVVPIVEEVAMAIVMKTVATGDATMIVAAGAVMSAVVTVVTVEMTDVTDAGMMVVVIAFAVLMVVVAVQIVSPLHMLILNVRFARNMAILQMSAGGATQMIRRTEIMVERGHTLFHMVLTQTGTLTQAPLITSPVN